MKDYGRYHTCGTCTVQMVQLAYARAPWFRLVREPLRAGMIVMARLHGIGRDLARVKSDRCDGCVRFYKNALKDGSALFRLLNGVVNPLFDRLMERYVSPEEVREAKDLARKEMEGVKGVSPGTFSI